MSDARDNPKLFSASHAGWRLIGIAGALFGLICVVGLIAAIALKNADALADIALVLAIAAFLVQMVVSAMQNSSSRQSAAESQRLNFETNAALEEIKASAKASQEVLSSQFDSLLQALIRRDGGGKGGKGGEDGPNLAAYDLARRNLRTNGSAEDLRAISELQSWPAEEHGVPALLTLRSLTPNAVASLERFRRDEISSRQSGALVGLPRNESPVGNVYSDELLRKGLIEEDGEHMGRLTESGKYVARLLRPDGDPPEWWIRETTAAAAHGTPPADGSADNGAAAETPT